MSDVDVAARIRDQRFTPVRVREGYDMNEVDTFLDRAVAAWTGREPLGPLVEAVRFTTVRLREGYDINEVDEFLGWLRAAPPRGSSGTDDIEVAPPRPGVTPPAGTTSPSVIQEQRGLLARLFQKR